MNSKQLSKKALCILAGMVVAFCAFGAPASPEDPYADATVWLKGFDDANSDGVMQTGELQSALVEPTPWNSIAMGDVNAPVVSNELVRTPYRGGSFRAQTLYFPHNVTITNTVNYEDGSATNFGYVTVNNFKLNGFTQKAGITNDNFTFTLRFRPDETQYRPDYSWIFNWGYNGKHNGFNIGMNYAGKAARSFVSNDRTVTNTVSYQRYTLSFFKLGGSEGSQANVFASAQGAVFADKWHDLIVSIDGEARKVRYILARAHWDLDSAPWITLSNLSDAGETVNKEFYSGEADLRDGWTYKPYADLTFGTEYGHVGFRQHNGTYESSDNSSKGFRGSIHQFAVWNRSMDFDEMKRALAFPRTDLMRVGVRDGTANEFRGGTGTDQDDVQWTLPASFASGDSATVTFSTHLQGESEMQQIFRWYGANDSADGSIALAVNGRSAGTQSVRAGQTSRWLLKPGLLVEGVNTLALTRTDSGAGAVKPDAVVLGGSWQIGHKNNHYHDFVHEGFGLQVRDVLDGNMYSVRRVLFGSVPSAAGKSAYTNTVFKFTVPHEFRTENYTWKLGWKDQLAAATHFPRWRLNGHDFDYTAAADKAYHEFEIPRDWLNVDGENELEIYNGGTYVKNSYYYYDYLRVMVEMRNGTFMIIR